MKLDFKKWLEGMMVTDEKAEEGKSRRKKGPKEGDMTPPGLPLQPKINPQSNSPIAQATKPMASNNQGMSNSMG